jgi:Holliday junction resolvase
MSPIQRRGRNNKHRGYTTEKQLEKFLNDNGIPAKRVPLSGALKFVGERKLRGDVTIECGKHPIRVEVKSRQKLPAYIVGVRHNKPWKVKEIEHLCYILTEEEFLTLCKEGSLPENRLKINSARCGGLVKWFKQDDSEIVAMKEFGKRSFYFAVKFKTAIKIGGKYK